MVGPNFFIDSWREDLQIWWKYLYYIYIGNIWNISLEVVFRLVSVLMYWPQWNHVGVSFKCFFLLLDTISPIWQIPIQYLLLFEMLKVLCENYCFDYSIYGCMVGSVQVQFLSLSWGQWNKLNHNQCIFAKQIP